MTLARFLFHDIRGERLSASTNSEAEKITTNSCARRLLRTRKNLPIKKQCDSPRSGSDCLSCGRAAAPTVTADARAAATCFNCPVV